MFIIWFFTVVLPFDSQVFIDTFIQRLGDAAAAGFYELIGVLLPMEPSTIAVCALPVKFTFLIQYAGGCYPHFFTYSSEANIAGLLCLVLGRLKFRASATIKGSEFSLENVTATFFNHAWSESG